jgi:16S rRNA (cytidine1402-2'-O)-methyltransferase
MEHPQAQVAVSQSLDPLFDRAGVSSQDLPPGALYVVATPIGNVADISLRALWVLQHCDAIFAEDTRTTRVLLARFRIEQPLFSAHEHNEAGVAAAIVARLQAGARIALVTDAGTPAISDPGARIVRAALDLQLRVVPVPGASSLTAAASVAGLQAAALRFIGFLPTHARSRARLLRALADSADACVLFEAPHRLADTARELAATFAPDRRVVIARELTKKFETVSVSRVADLPAHVASAGARGEYVLLIDAPPRAPGAAQGPGVAAPGTPAAHEPDLADAAAADPLEDTTRAWLDALAGALPPSRAAAVAARATGLPRARLYRYLAQGAGAAGGGADIDADVDADVDADGASDGVLDSDRDNSAGSGPDNRIA